MHILVSPLQARGLVINTLKENILTNQTFVTLAGGVAWFQTYVDTTMPIIQWVIASGTAVLVLFNVTLKGMELYKRLKSNKMGKEKD